MTTGADVVATARACLGARFRHQGRSPATGLDCIGLVFFIQKTLGLSCYDYQTYPRYPDHHKLTEILQSQFNRVSLHEIQPGDVLRFLAGADPVHLGIATDIGVIHSTALARGVVEHRLDPSWTSRLVEAYRIPGIN